MRSACAALVALAFGSLLFFPAQRALARSGGMRVLLGATVSDAAAGTMAQPLWQKMVSDFIGGEIVPFAGGLPKVSDCVKNNVDYIVDAPFDLRPRLPGIPYAGDRTAAQSRITVINCFTGSTIFDRTIAFDSEPAGNEPEGDIDSVPEYSWSKTIPAALHKYALAFPRIARIVSVQAPFALIDAGSSSLREGQLMRVFAHADRSKVAEPIVLTVTTVDGRYVQVAFSTLPGAVAPLQGDLVEPLANDALSSPSPAPSAPAATVPPRTTASPKPGSTG